MRLTMKTIEPRTVVAFPKATFTHSYLTDENPSRVWTSGDLFDWQKELRPKKSDGGHWLDWREKIMRLLEEICEQRAKVIPQLLKDAEVADKELEDLNLHLKVRRMELSKRLTANHLSQTSCSFLRDYEAQFTLIESKRKLLDARAQLLDLMSMCVVRMIQAKLGVLLPLKLKVEEVPEEKWAADYGHYHDGITMCHTIHTAVYVWHLADADDGLLHMDAMRDYPMILKHIIPKEKFTKLAMKYHDRAVAKADARDKSKIAIGTPEEVRRLADQNKAVNG